MRSKLKKAFLTVVAWIALLVTLYLLIAYEFLRVILGVIFMLGIVVFGSSALKSGAMTILGILALGIILIWLFGL